MQVKKIAILGSTGSIGQSTLKVAAHLKEFIQVKALVAKSNIDLLEEQANLFHPEIIAVYDKEKAFELQKRLPNFQVLGGMEGVLEAATFDAVDFVVSAMVGSVGILPTLSAIKAGKSIGLANKEVLIAAGDIVMKAARENGVQVLPVDSEHSAIFQCLQGQKKEEIRKIILTASGGPFREHTLEKLLKVTPTCALKHPNWSMGNKVTIDSSTLMNKGLEMIEAHHLFNVPYDQIEVIIHPQSLIHSFVEYIDGSLLAQIAEHDMIIPIQYALTYPERKKGIVPCFDFTKYSKMDFFPPDHERFPCLGLAYEAMKEGKTMPCFMNAANEVLVESFLSGKIGWIDIGKKLEKLMLSHQVIDANNLSELFAVDHAAREQAYHLVKRT